MIDEDRQRRTVHFSGHVQGVGFRYAVLRIAQKLPLTGYVRNLPNGEVELVVEGKSDEIDSLLSRVAEAMKRHIKDRRDVTSAATGEFDAFDIAR